MRHDEERRAALTEHALDPVAYFLGATEEALSLAQNWECREAFERACRLIGYDGSMAFDSLADGVVQPTVQVYAKRQTRIGDSSGWRVDVFSTHTVVFRTGLWGTEEMRLTEWSHHVEPADPGSVPL